MGADEDLEAVLGDMGTGGAPSVDLAPFGPGTGTLYTDAATIRAVQKALNAKGLKVAVDGVFGPETEAAVFKATGQHGPPNDAVLAQLGVTPQAAPAKKPAVQDPYARLLPGTPAPVDNAGVPPPSAFVAFMAKPLWSGSPIRVWQAGLGGVGVLAILAGILSAFRRRR